MTTTPANDLIRDLQAEVEQLRENTVLCFDCPHGNIAACFGSYEESPLKPSCNECCGHSNENGSCDSIDQEFWSGWQQILDRDNEQANEIEQLRATNLDQLSLINGVVTQLNRVGLHYSMYGPDETVATVLRDYIDELQSC